MCRSCFLFLKALVPHVDVDEFMMIIGWRDRLENPRLPYRAYLTIDRYEAPFDQP
jgi:hypothetical protein